MCGYEADTSKTSTYDAKKSKRGISKSLKTKPTTGTSERLLESKSKKMTKPIVVPTTMDKNLYKKVDPIKMLDLDDNFDDEEIDDDVQKILNEQPKRRGRPRKNPINIEENNEETKPKKRGRPRKNPIVEDEIEEIDKLQQLTNEDFENESVKQVTNDIIEEDEVDNNILPGLEDNINEEESGEEMILPGLDDDEQSSVNEELSDNNEDLDDFLGDKKQDLEKNNYNDEFYSDEDDNTNLQDSNKYMKSYDNIFDDEEFEGLLSKEKKVVSFVGTSKNGTSFLVNNLAIILSNMGINTAILDATSNKNAFYIYKKNYEELRKTASNSFENLINETADGIKVNNNLTVYTTIPSKAELINSSRPILETLIRNHSLVIIDSDFNTPIEYFDKSQEIYLVQSMDILTIQPLTEFLRELKVKNILNESKIRIVLNKLLKLKGVNPKNIIGGMSNYNDPEMAFMTELFNRNSVKVSAQIPFDEDVYMKYLNSIAECDIQINGYPKEFKQRLNLLAETIYPLLPGKKDKKSKKNDRVFSSSFSPGMNSTLDNMRKKY